MNTIGLAVFSCVGLMFLASHLTEYNSSHSTDQQFDQLNGLLGETPKFKSLDYSGLTDAYQSSRTLQSQENQLANFLGYPNGNPNQND